MPVCIIIIFFKTFLMTGQVKQVCSDILGFTSGGFSTSDHSPYEDEEYLYCSEPHIVALAMQHQQCRAEVGYHIVEILCTL